MLNLFEGGFAPPIAIQLFNLIDFNSYSITTYLKVGLQYNDKCNTMTVAMYKVIELHGLFQ